MPSTKANELVVRSDFSPEKSNSPAGQLMARISSDALNFARGAAAVADERTVYNVDPSSSNAVECEDALAIDYAALKAWAAAIGLTQDSISLSQSSASINFECKSDFSDVITPKLNIVNDIEFTNLKTNTLGVRRLRGIASVHVSKNDIGCFLLSGIEKLDIVDLDRNEALLYLGIESCGEINHIFGKSTSINEINIASTTSVDRIDLTNCRINHVSFIKIARIRRLELICNFIKNLDLSDVMLIEEIDCSINEISKITISNKSGIRYISCNRNLLTMFDATNFVDLRDLSIGHNKLTHLNISGSVNLRSLLCYGNLLEIIDLSDCYLLEFIDCSDNIISQIDVSRLSKLESLICTGNLIKEIDVRYNLSLKHLECDPEVHVLKHDWQVFEND